MHPPPPPSPAPVSRLMLGILLFVLLGTPLVALLWETLNELLSGRFPVGRVLLAVPVAALFAVLLRVLAGRVRRWGDDHAAHPPPETRP